MFDENRNEFLVYRYFNNYTFEATKVSKFKYDNTGISSLGPLIFLEKESFCSLIFILHDGKKIRTPIIDDVEEKYIEIKVYFQKDNQVK